MEAVEVVTKYPNIVEFVMPLQRSTPKKVSEDFTKGLRGRYLHNLSAGFYSSLYMKKVEIF